MLQTSPLAQIMAPDALPLGLGCSRLGSVNGASGDEARALLHAALARGVRFFDTSNIYAQGDSERLLAEVLGKRDDCVICSKAGKYLDWKKQALVPLKGLLRNVARRSKQASRGVAAARAKPMPTRWDGPFLSSSIDGSLRRLKRERIEMFMLHSPSADVVARGEAVAALEAAQQAGKIGLIGVSVDDVATAEAALGDPRVQALQLPLLPGETEFDSVTQRAADAGVAVIAREILGGAQAISGAMDPARYAADRIAEMVRDPRVALPLVGTTRMVNLQASADAAEVATKA
ncbi:Predicted oxidoreductase [Salipiger thiooxidans]|uniref:Predicted oxidoreductase n=1 Tax=Salipiger thiooxidans TaxID=282683 RepID=A0A1G7N957_9RHOB|nr:aldo/keto reductase [Salipiger thiooxidans]SDF69830.1 Predicted oxidoreductase [Salipiger thiooxidans]